VKRRNGWSEAELRMLVARTGRSRVLVEAFCDAVDRKLYLQLGERQRRATLHFHLDVDSLQDEADAPPDES